MFLPWWQRPGLYREELKALKKAGIPYKRYRDVFQQDGIVKLRISSTINGTTYELDVIYPDFYPFVRFEVFSQGLGLPRHENWFRNNLCLPGRATENWFVTDTVAGVIEDQLPTVVSYDPQLIAQKEEPQAVPASDYYDYSPFSSILIDGSWKLRSENINGKIKIRGDLFPILTSEGQKLIARGCVLELILQGGESIAELDPRLGQPYKSNWEGSWYYVDEPLRDNNPSSFLDKLQNHHPGSKHVKWNHIGNSVSIGIIGVIFREELRLNEYGDGWIFVVRIKKGKGYKAKEPAPFFVRAARGGQK